MSLLSWAQDPTSLGPITIQYNAWQTTASMPALGIICQYCSLISPSFIHGIIYQQPLMNQDIGSPSKNTASAPVVDPPLTFQSLDVCARCRKSFNF